MNRDFLSPPRPEPPRFDATLGAWVLSRYQDVVRAFHEPRFAIEVDETSRLVVPPSRLPAWREQFERLARQTIATLSTDRPVDIMGEFARPWSLRAAVLVTGVNAADAERFEDLARQVSAAVSEPRDDLVRSRAATADAELKKAFLGPDMPLDSSAFVALSQTLPCLLANIWLALLRHPMELARLRAEPDLMPAAVEELLRYTTMARKVRRRAAARVDLGGVTIAEGEQVILMLASANRDPAQFADPDRLDLTRRANGQIALGGGAHSCLGGPLIRAAVGAATSAFVPRCKDGAASREVEWRGGTGYRWPEPLFVTLTRDAGESA